MAIVNSYVKLPEGRGIQNHQQPEKYYEFGNHFNDHPGMPSVN
jgi:hypothetical protein